LAPQIPAMPEEGVLKLPLPWQSRGNIGLYGSILNDSRIKISHPSTFILDIAAFFLDEKSMFIHQRRLIMTTKFLNLILCLILSLSFIPFAFGESLTLKDRKSFYQTCLQDILLKCKNKCCLKKSRSKNLRACAELAEHKANFIMQQQDKLIADMLKANYPLKTYKIKYFVNQQFFANSRH
jgi:hypothetical protein